MIQDPEDMVTKFAAEAKVTLSYAEIAPMSFFFFFFFPWVERRLKLCEDEGAGSG